MVMAVAYFILFLVSRLDVPIPSAHCGKSFTTPNIDTLVFPSKCGRHRCDLFTKLLRVICSFIFLFCNPLPFTANVIFTHYPIYIGYWKIYNNLRFWFTIYFNKLFYYYFNKIQNNNRKLTFLNS